MRRETGSRPSTCRATTSSIHAGSGFGSAPCRNRHSTFATCPSLIPSAAAISRCEKTFARLSAHTASRRAGFAAGPIAGAFTWATVHSAIAATSLRTFVTVGGSACTGRGALGFFAVRACCGAAGAVSQPVSRSIASGHATWCFRRARISSSIPSAPPSRSRKKAVRSHSGARSFPRYARRLVQHGSSRRVAIERLQFPVRRVALARRHGAERRPGDPAALRVAANPEAAGTREQPVRVVSVRHRAAGHRLRRDAQVVVVRPRDRAGDGAGPGLAPRQRTVVRVPEHAVVRRRHRRDPAGGVVADGRRASGRGDRLQAPGGVVRRDDRALAPGSAGSTRGSPQASVKSKVLTPSPDPITSYERWVDRNAVPSGPPQVIDPATI